MDKSGRIFLIFSLAISLNHHCAAQDWPQWRGPHGNGSVKIHPDQRLPPTQWSDVKNIAWKTPIVGRGHSTPIVISDRVFLTTATAVGDPLPPRMSGRPGEHDNLPVSSKFQFSVICVDRKEGRILWNKVVHEAVPIEGGHISASLASASAVADNRFVIAMFGSHGLYCFDHTGALVWSKTLGQMHTKHGHGEGASPVLRDDTLVINWDHEESSFIVAFDVKNGHELWRKKRNEDTSWSSPQIIDVDGQLQIVVCGTNRIRGYELNTGDVLWECGGLSSNIVASPVYDSASGILVAGSSYEIRKLLAIRLAGAKGDITDSDRIVWSRSRGTPYVPSLLSADGQVYFLTHYQNILTRVRIADGKDAPGPMRLGDLGNIYASPVSDGRHVYVTDLDGNTLVMTASDQPDRVSVNRLGEAVSASLAIAGDEIFVRGEQHLYCIRESH